MEVPKPFPAHFALPEGGIIHAAVEPGEHLVGLHQRKRRVQVLQVRKRRVPVVDQRKRRVLVLQQRKRLSGRAPQGRGDPGETPLLVR